MVMNIYTREAWGAEIPKSETPSNWKVTHVFWMNVKKNVCYTKQHCTESLRRAQHYNMDIQNQRDIRYNFMIGGDGNVYEGRGWGTAPLLPKEFSRANSESLLIGFMGQFNTARDLPAPMFKLGQDLITNGIACRFIVRDFIFLDFLTSNRKGDEKEQHKEIQQSRPVWYQPDPLANPFKRQGLRELEERILAKELPENMFLLGQDLVAYGVANNLINKDFQFFDLLTPLHEWKQDYGGQPTFQSQSRGYKDGNEGGYKRGYGGREGSLQPNYGYGSRWYKEAIV